MPNPIKQAFDFRFDDTIRRQVSDDEETQNVAAMLSRGNRVSQSQQGVEAGLKTTKKFIPPDTRVKSAPGVITSRKINMADDKPSRSKEVLGSKKKDEPTLRELRRMSLEHTNNGYVKATHDYGDDKPETHALAKDGFFDHLKKTFNLSEEKKAIDAKKSNVDAYEKEHGSLTKPKAATLAEPSSYDKIRARLREKAAQPPSSDTDLSDRFNALTKSLNR